MAVCVLPTTWVLLRIAYRPGPQDYAQQLQLQLGVPVIVGRVATPSPELTWLYDVQWQHPETGQWAVADRLTFWHGGALETRARWQIDQLTVSEAALNDVLSQFHQNIVRQRLYSSTSEHAASNSSIPVLHVRSLMVMPGGGVNSPSEALARPVAKLNDVLVHWCTDSVGTTPRLEIAAKLVPPRIDADLLVVDSPSAEVPVVASVERQSIQNQTTGQREYTTRWEVAVLERPLPLLWLNLGSWSKWLGDRSELEFSGLIGGTIFGDRWQLTCRQADIRGWELSELEHLLGGERSRNQARLNMKVHEVTWIGTAQELRQWETCDVELMASDGVLDTRWLRLAEQSLGLRPTDGSVQPASFVGDDGQANNLRFRELNFGVRLQDGRWFFSPIDSNMKKLPILQSPNQEEQIEWPNREPREWDVERATHAAARVSYVETTSADASEESTRPPLEIAPVEFTWQPNQFIQGVPQSDSIYQELVGLPPPEPNSNSLDLQHWLEHPTSTSDPLPK